MAKYISQAENVDIRHACNGGEVVIQINGKTYKVDGYCENTKTIYQFHGCYFHGCSSCYDELTVNRLSQYNIVTPSIRAAALPNIGRASIGVAASVNSQWRCARYSAGDAIGI